MMRQLPPGSSDSKARYATPLPAALGTPTYLAGGRQHVAVMTGAADSFWQADRGPSTVVVFGLL